MGLRLVGLVLASVVHSQLNGALYIHACVLSPMHDSRLGPDFDGDFKASGLVCKLVYMLAVRRRTPRY